MSKHAIVLLLLPWLMLACDKDKDHPQIHMLMWTYTSNQTVRSTWN
jgi:hypothetical protein